MIPVRVEIISYDKESNTCKARLLNGDIINLDPFVSCAINLTDEEYSKGLGFDVVGKMYVLIEYTVYRENVVPRERGMLEI